MKFIEINKYSEIKCDSCDIEDWGTFLEFPNGYKICRDCVDDIVIENEVNNLRNELRDKLNN